MIDKINIIGDKTRPSKKEWPSVSPTRVNGWVANERKLHFGKMVNLDNVSIVFPYNFEP